MSDIQKLNLATLRLFNSIQVADSFEKKDLSPVTIARCVKNGYLIQPDVPQDVGIFRDIESVIGISGEKANASFHKSWDKVRTASLEQLVLEQVLHYITTYGYEEIGIYRSDTVFIPNEILDVPEFSEDILLTVVSAMSQRQVMLGIVKLGGYGIALAQETLDDIMTIVEYNEDSYSSDYVHGIKNRELKALLFDFYGLVPTEPVEFLRHLISKLTGESLLIKSRKLISLIDIADGKHLDTLLIDAPKNFASIFLRYRVLFLAMKRISVRKKGYFNQMRRDADKMKVSAPFDYLNHVTELIQKKELNLNVLKKVLKTATVFRKVRLAYALNYRLQEYTPSIVYTVRNGKGWVTSFEWDTGKYKVRVAQALRATLSSIVGDIKENVDGKVFYIPECVSYNVPSSEKQFVGNIPTGSHISVPASSQMIAGIHWTNLENNRVDIDLSLVGSGVKIGWDALYRSGDRQTLFSGDIVDAPAPRGASELHRITELDQPLVLMANYYNYSEDHPVKMKIMVSDEVVADFGGHRRNYMLDQNRIVSQTTVTLDEKQMAVGLIIPVGDEKRLYFISTNVGNSISSSYGEQADQIREYLVASSMNSISLEGLLEEAGATIVNDVPEDGEYVDLSPENLNKTTIIDLLV